MISRIAPCSGIAFCRVLKGLQQISYCVDEPGCPAGIITQIFFIHVVALRQFQLYGVNTIGGRAMAARDKGAAKPAVSNAGISRCVRNSRYRRCYVSRTTVVPVRANIEVGETAVSGTLRSVP